MIKMDETLIGTWFVGGKDKDWLGGINLVEKDGKKIYKLTYRFRYHTDDSNPWEMKDKKSWYQGEIDAAKYSIEYMLAVMRGMVGLIKREYETTESYEYLLSAYPSIDAMMNAFF